jgi:hypothetical protein
MTWTPDSCEYSDGPDTVDGAASGELRGVTSRYTALGDVLLIASIPLPPSADVEVVADADDPNRHRVSQRAIGSG